MKVKESEGKLLNSTVNCMNCSTGFRDELTAGLHTEGALTINHPSKVSLPCC